MDDLPAPKNGLAPKSGPDTIGGTHNVSVKLDPDQCLTGAVTPIPGDTLPHTAGKPYLPEN